MRRGGEETTFKRRLILFLRFAFCVLLVGENAVTATRTSYSYDDELPIRRSTSVEHAQLLSSESVPLVSLWSATRVASRVAAEEEDGPREPPTPRASPLHSLERPSHLSTSHQSSSSERRAAAIIRARRPSKETRERGGSSVVSERKSNANRTRSERESNAKSARGRKVERREGGTYTPAFPDRTGTA